MQYPVKNQNDWSQVGKLSHVKKLEIFLRNKRYQKEFRKEYNVILKPLKTSRDTYNESEIFCVSIVKNAEKNILSFLSHYRKMGIKRFVFVDDRSDDETRAILSGMSDVDLFESNVEYKEAERGAVWRDMIVDLYGRNRWYLSVDSDEYLIFPGCESRPAASFVEDLTRSGLKRALAAMIDIYPEHALHQASPHVPPEAPPTDFSPLFDGSGYWLENDKNCMAVRGGPRYRLFGADMRLTKFPLIFADELTKFNSSSSHGPLPLRRNYSPIHAVLLHYKFQFGAAEDFRRIAQRQSHAGGSHFYKTILAHDSFHEEAVLRYEHSLAFTTSEELVKLGFMLDLRRQVEGRDQ